MNFTGTATVSLEKQAFDFYIGRTDDAAASCVNATTLYSEALLLASRSGMQFVISNKVGSLTAAQLVSEQALVRVSASLSTQLQGSFTADAKAKFEAAFRSEVSKRSSASGAAQIAIDVYEFRLDGSFGQVQVVEAGTASLRPWITAFPIFAPCEGKRLVTAVLGMYVKSLNADGKKQTEDLLTASAQAALEGAIGGSAWNASLKSSVETEVQNVTAKRAELTVSLETRFIPAWYRVETVTPVPRRCANVDGVRVGSGDAKDADTCKKLLGDFRQPPPPVRSVSSAVPAVHILKWYADSKNSKVAIVCQCDEQEAL